MTNSKSLRSTLEYQSSTSSSNNHIITHMVSQKKYFEKEMVWVGEIAIFY